MHFRKHATQAAVHLGKRAKYHHVLPSRLPALGFYLSGDIGSSISCSRSRTRAFSSGSEPPINKFYWQGPERIPLTQRSNLRTCSIHAEDLTTLEKHWQSLQTNPTWAVHPHTIVVLLVTPALAVMLREGNAFIPDQLLPWLYPGAKRGSVQMVAAVVDEIPYKPHIGDLHSMQTGSQGISVYSADSNVGSEKLLQFLSHQAVANESSSDDVVDAITLEIGKAPTSDEKYDYKTSYQVRLPLANTIFQNGNEHTFLVQNWNIEASGSEKPRFALSGSARMKDSHVPLLESQTHGNVSRFLYANMSPVTPWRFVEGCMGNVLSTLKTQQAEEDIVPASQELEALLPEYLSNFHPRKYEIWAQVIQKSEWTSYGFVSRCPAQKYFDPIAMGHHFHRVLSGGGGWGNRQGLVALDPDPDFGLSDKDMGSRPFASPLQEVARPGDAVRFLAIHARDDEPKPNDSKPDIKRRSPRNTPNIRYTRSRSGYNFGTVAPDDPTTSDAVVAEYQKNSSPKDLLTVTRSFGGQSQKGACVSINVSGPGLPLTNIVKTKLPPFTYFSYRQARG